MILWLTANSGAGKTTLAQKLKGPNTVILDGDEIRSVYNDWDLSTEGRRQQNLRVAKLAKLLESQGLTVIVAVIAPFQSIRDEVQAITDCRFIYIPFEGDDEIEDKPYERPTNCITLKERVL